MTPTGRFNAILRAAMEEALRLEEDLAAVYASALRKAGRSVAEAFVEQERAILAASDRGGLVAAGEWVPPELPALDPELLERARLKREQAAAAIEETLSTRIAGLAISFDPETFQVFSPSLLEPLAQHAAANFTATMQEKTASIIEESFNRGLSVPDTARAIQVGVAGASPATATMLARTDLVALANGGSFIAAKVVYEKDVVYKTWLNAGDARVRPSHATAGGQTVPLDAPFRVGGFELMYPGDPQGPPGEVIHCRCTFTVAETLTAAAEEEESMTTTETETTAGVGWRSVLVLEGVPTEDGRLIEPGALDWRDLPLSLMAMTATGPGGHEGANVAGRIDTIRRDGGEILGEGIFDRGEIGLEVERLVTEEMLRGISVDLAIKEFELRTEGGKVVDDPFDMPEDEALLFVITEASIMGATVCPFPAFADANIELLAAAEGYQLARVTNLSTMQLATTEEVVPAPEEDGEGQASLVEDLRGLLADSASMGVSARGFAWNVQGSDFSEARALFLAIEKDISAGIGRLADSIRQLGGRAPVSLSEIEALRSVGDASDLVTIFDMTANLKTQNDRVLAALNRAHLTAVGASEEGTANFLAERIDRHQRWDWQLRVSIAA